MAEREEPPLVEPEIVSCVYLTGADISVENDVLTFVGWHEADGERRIKIRYALPLPIAQALNRKFRRLFGAGH